MAPRLLFMFKILILYFQPLYSTWTTSARSTTIPYLQTQTTTLEANNWKQELKHLQSALNYLKEKYKDLEIHSTSTQSLTSATLLTTKPTPQPIEAEISLLRNQIASLQTALTELEQKYTNLKSLKPNSYPFIAFEARITQPLVGLGPNQIVVFDKILMNKGNGYDSRIGVFRCPVNGTYHLALSIACFGRTQLEIVNNGFQIAHVFASRPRRRQMLFKRSANVMPRQNPDSMTTVTPAPWTLAPKVSILTPHRSDAGLASIQILVDLKAGDDVWVRHLDNDIDNVLLSDTFTTFSGYIVHAG